MDHRYLAGRPEKTALRVARSMHKKGAVFARQRPKINCLLRAYAAALTLRSNFVDLSNLLKNAITALASLLDIFRF